jgi:hypothetical protein
MPRSFIGLLLCCLLALNASRTATAAALPQIDIPH